MRTVEVLQVGPLPTDAVELLQARFLLRTMDRGSPAGEPMPRVRGIATNGKTVVDEALMARLPSLEIISCIGAGTEGIDSEAGRSRGVTLATTSEVLAGDVADVALGLIIAWARDFSGAERFLRSGRWADGRHRLGRSLQAARLGIMGLGTIGRALAARAEACGMEIGYHNRSCVEGSRYRYFSGLRGMAEWCDVLAVCCPGGPATFRLVDEEILSALGMDGFLVNVARGSVVDEAALASALIAEKIGGAGLDVYENEPDPAPALMESGRATLLPHIGSATEQTRAAMSRAMVEALVRKLL